MLQCQIHIADQDSTQNSLKYHGAASTGIQGSPEGGAETTKKEDMKKIGDGIGLGAKRGRPKKGMEKKPEVSMRTLRSREKTE